MKKYALVALLIILCSGCTKKQTLTCTKKQTDNGFTMEETRVFEVENDKAITLNIDTKFNLEGDYLEYKDIVKENIDEITNAYENKKGIQVSNLEQGNNIIVNLIVDYNDTDLEIDNDLFNVGLYVNGIDIENVKNDLENQEYSCSLSNK